MFCSLCESPLSAEKAEGSIGSLSTNVSSGKGKKDQDRSIGDRATRGPTASKNPLTELLPSKTLAGRYELEKKIGKGGFAVVYRGYDRNLDGPVAIKCLVPRKQGEGMSEQELARFKREVRSILKLNHTNIVRVYDTHQDQDGYYIVMEYFAGGSLRQLLRKKGKLPVQEAVRLVQDVCEGLAFAHRKKIIHRDIKPDNIMLEEEEGQRIAKIVDFGLVRDGQEVGLSMTGQRMGTFYYMSPEQHLDAKNVNQTTDIYAVGKTLYELVTGEVPDNLDPDKLEAYPDLAKILLKCVKARPEERYASMDDLHAALDELTFPEPVSEEESQYHQLLSKARRAVQKGHYREAETLVDQIDPSFQKEAEVVAFQKELQKKSAPSREDARRRKKQAKKEKEQIQSLNFPEQLEEAIQLTEKMMELEIVDWDDDELTGYGQWAATHYEELRTYAEELRTNERRETERIDYLEAAQREFDSGGYQQAAETLEKIHPTLQDGFDFEELSRQIENELRTPPPPPPPRSDYSYERWRSSVNADQTHRKLIAARDRVTAAKKKEQWRIATVLCGVLLLLLILILSVLIRNDLGLAAQRKAEILASEKSADEEAVRALRSLGATMREDVDENVVYVSLFGTQISDDGLVHLKRLTDLTYLNLADTQISDSGLENLKGLTKLQVLRLSNTKVSDVGVEYLKGLENLKSLSLRSTAMTETGLVQLQKALPNCKITR